MEQSRPRLTSGLFHSAKVLIVENGDHSSERIYPEVFKNAIQKLISCLEIISLFLKIIFGEKSQKIP